MTRRDPVRMELSFTRPPLTMNQQRHWRKRAPIVKALRHEAFVRARAMRIPRVERAEIILHYQAPDNRRRDEDNLIPTRKPLVDGLVDAGVIPDDDHRYVTGQMVQIHPAVKGELGCMWLTIEPAC